MSASLGRSEPGRESLPRGFFVSGFCRAGGAEVPAAAYSSRAYFLILRARRWRSICLRLRCRKATTSATSDLGQSRKSAFVFGMSAFAGKAVVTGPKTDIGSLSFAIGGKPDVDFKSRYVSK